MQGSAAPITGRLPRVLNDIRVFAPFAFARHPSAIAKEWDGGARDIAYEYGVKNGEPCPTAYEAAHTFKKRIVREMKWRLSKEIIVRAAQVDGRSLNGQRPVIDALNDYVGHGIITAFAGDVLLEAAGLALGVPEYVPHTSLARLLEAAISYVAEDDLPEHKTIRILASAVEHHGITEQMLSTTYAREERAELFMQIPQLSVELENRLLRMIGNVRNYSQLEIRHGITEELITRSMNAGVLPHAGGVAALNLLRARGKVFYQELNSYGLNRAGSIFFGTMSIAALIFMLLYVGAMSPREIKVMFSASGLFGLAGAYCGAKWYLSPYRIYKD